MSNIETAIKLAIERGGYKPHAHEASFNLEAFKKNNYKASNRTKAIFVLDPLFWQALGQALGWGYKDIDGKEWRVGAYGKLDAWLGHSLEYFYLKLTNGNESEFWSNLLNREN